MKATAKKSPLSGLVIRTAIVRRPDLGFIYACDLKMEAKGIPHAVTFKWQDGQFTRGECNFDADTVCVIQQPEFGIVAASDAGYYSVNRPAGTVTGDLFKNSAPPPKKRRTTGIVSVVEVGEKAFAVGLGGMVYRLDKLTQWTRIDDGLPEDFRIQDIHGFSASDLYAVGFYGQLWHCNGSQWKAIKLPTKQHLNSVKCAENGTVFIAGNGGVMISGSKEKWKLFENKQMKADIWDLEWFRGNLYASTMEAVYQLKGKRLERMDFGKDSPETCNQLSAAPGVLWSIGEEDILSYDGKTWTRVI